MGSKFRYSGKTEFQTIVENRRRLIRTERIFIRNNARNATMPAALITHGNQNNNNAMNSQKSTIMINDAQKHIINLKLSTIGPTGSSTDNNTNAITRMITNGALNRFNRQNNQRNHSPLSSIESTSCSLSSSSASSLLGPSATKIANKIQTLDSDKTICNSVLSAKQLSNNPQQNINQKPLETCSTITSQSVLKKFSINTTSTSTTTSSSSSLESSFMPNEDNVDDTDNNNTCMEMKQKQTENNVDLFGNPKQLNTCDTININNSKLKNDESVNDHSTVISIFGNSNNCPTTMETKM